MATPKNIDANESLICPYSLEDGISSANEIYIIIPETTAKTIPRTKSLINGFKNKNEINAPRGSAIPERNEYFNAFALLLVAKYIGMAMAIPSGIL